MTLPEAVQRVASSRLGSPVVSVEWTSGRVGVVRAVRLADGRRCVVKSRPARVGLLRRLQTVVRVQSLLHAAGVPLPRPLAGPAQVGDVVLTFDALVTATPGERAADVAPDEARALSLSMLLRIVDLGAVHLPAAPELLSVSPWIDSDTARRDGRAWPVPHDPALLGPTLDGADAGVAELAAAAADVLGEWWRRPDRVLGHDDWEAQNLRFAVVDGAPVVTAVFDPESLALLPEPVLAGAAGLQHGRGLPGAADAPGVAEVDAWIGRFAARRGGRPPEWFGAAWAAAAWGLAYNARCDELLGVTAEDSHLRACRRDGDRYLARLGR